MLHSAQCQQSGNLILDSLPSNEYDLLHPHLKKVQLRQNEILCRIREPIEQVYFPSTALLSWVHSTVEGGTVEVGATGFEGLVGTTFLLERDDTPWQTNVIVAGEAYQLSPEVFVNALQNSIVLQQKLKAFTYLKLMQVTQSALCNRFHSVEQRLCRWLLAAEDRVKTPELRLTQDILATMIGSNRPAVSIVTGTLQSSGLIRTSRGKVTILNREEMEKTTCECYHIVKQEYDRYLKR
ncbi:Crp/Fnr family transcriptional regulator [Aerosakkonemataceae cyanobacterium BLCC-F50]|uniref:Crp/Fnr family transcriptional regulator n=1 Tax=Floridaenema flaviceps BLCC-F50 TaxID=3153642 RepID=A0ABV4XXA5_9CYAN